MDNKQSGDNGKVIGFILFLLETGLDVIFYGAAIVFFLIFGFFTIDRYVHFLAAWLFALVYILIVIFFTYKRFQWYLNSKI